MNCPEVRKLTHLFVDGALDARSNVDVLAHLNMCGACNERFSEARRFEDFLRERLRPEPAPEGVRARVSLRLAEATAPWPIRLLGGARRRPVAAISGFAAVLAIAVAAWQVMGVYRMCPYVRDTYRNYEALQQGKLPPLPERGPRRDFANAVPAPAIPGLVQNASAACEVNNRGAVMYAYRMDHCPEDRKCVMLFCVDAAGLWIGDHACTIRDGKKFAQWEYEGLHIVCWKDERLGIYCLMACEKSEMEGAALLNIASTVPR
jgi:anti-sigma factor RsiW